MSMSNNTMKYVGTYVDDDVLGKLKAYSKKSKRSLAAELRCAIDAWIKITETGTFDRRATPRK